VAEIHSVDVELEDLVLGVVVLEPDGEQTFLHLALEILLGREEEVLGDLLGDGRSAAGDVAGSDGFERDRSKADHVDAEMIVEAAIFDGDESSGHEFGQLVQRDGFAAGFAAIGNKLAIRGDDTDVGRALGHGPRRHRRHLHPVVVDDAATGEHRDDGERGAPVEQAAEEAPDGEGLAFALATSGLLLFWGTTLGGAAARSRLVVVVVIGGKAGFDTLATGGLFGLGFRCRFRPGARPFGRAPDPVFGRNLEIHE
jgi:hypothetical protein